MIYKETGQYKSSYKSDHAIFPLIQDKIAFSTLMLIAFLVIPFVIIASESYSAITLSSSSLMSTQICDMQPGIIFALIFFSVHLHVFYGFWKSLSMCFWLKSSPQNRKSYIRNRLIFLSEGFVYSLKPLYLLPIL